MERLGWGIGSDRTDSSTVCVCVCVFGKGGGNVVRNRYNFLNLF